MTMAKAETARKSVPGMHGPCPPTDTCVRNTEDWHDTGSTLSQPPTASSRRCEQFPCSHSATKTVNSSEEYFFTPPPPTPPPFLFFNLHCQVVKTWTKRNQMFDWSTNAVYVCNDFFHCSFCNGGGHGAGKMMALRNENLTKFS